VEAYFDPLADSTAGPQVGGVTPVSNGVLAWDTGPGGALLCARGELTCAPMTISGAADSSKSPTSHLLPGASLSALTADTCA
jgi:hypothetical protein